MNPIQHHRTVLKELLAVQKDLAERLQVRADLLDEILQALNSCELTVAVVGEVKRGKSTFLNALVGAKLFPSRASICTAGVTVLDFGEKPRAEILFKDGGKDEIDLSPQDPMRQLMEIVSRNNTKVKDISFVRVWFPNPFTGNGVLLVDTPGVNDPDNWREEITYSYLASADAVIMLLDPMQPISASEAEFLEKKILGQSIANLLFVLNKIDEVSPNDRIASMRRIEQVLSKYVPNPVIYPLSSKMALNAKLCGDATLLAPTGFPEFEEGLLAFLAKGRAGLLLKTKIQKTSDHLAALEEAVTARIGALDADHDQVARQLDAAEKELSDIHRQKQELEAKLDRLTGEIRRKLEQTVDSRSHYFTANLREVIRSEADWALLRSNVLTYQRDTISAFRATVQDEFHTLTQRFEVESARLDDRALGLMDDLHQAASGSMESIQIQTSLRRRPDKSGSDKVKLGAAVGGGVGALAGATLASSLSTATFTATTIAVTGLSTAGILSVGVLTGGLGLLVGAGIAAMLAKKAWDKGKSAYIETNELTDNRQAIAGVERFLQRLRASSESMSEAVVASARQTLLEPLQAKIDHQRELNRQIRTDLEKTNVDQATTRSTLKGLHNEVNKLRGRYVELIRQVN